MVMHYGIKFYLVVTLAAFNLARCENEPIENADVLPESLNSDVTNLVVTVNEDMNSDSLSSAVNETSRPDENVTNVDNIKVAVPFCEPYSSENDTGQPIEIVSLETAMNLITSHRNSHPVVPLVTVPIDSKENSTELPSESSNNTNITASSTSTSLTGGRCIAIYLFARWCSFSAASAPYISALAKVFSSCCMKFVAVDAANDMSGTTTFFGAGSVPQLIIYRPHRPVVRVSPVTSDLPLLVELVNNATGFNVSIANSSLVPDYDDFHDNVLPLAPIRETDMYLIAAWVHTLFTLVVVAYKFDYVRNLILSIWNYLRGFGQEIHAHLE